MRKDKDKDRDCGCGYPAYPTYPVPNMMPGIPTMPNIVPNYSMDMMNVPNYFQGNTTSSNNLEQQIASLSSQVSSL